MPKEKHDQLYAVLMTLLTLPKKNTQTTKGYEGFSCTSWHRGNSFRINNQGPQQAKI
jgi:hypothetical protein